MGVGDKKKLEETFWEAFLITGLRWWPPVQGQTAMRWIEVGRIKGYLRS